MEIRKKVTKVRTTGKKRDIIKNFTPDEIMEDRIRIFVGEQEVMTRTMHFIATSLIEELQKYIPELHYEVYKEFKKVEDTWSVIIGGEKCFVYNDGTVEVETYNDTNEKHIKAVKKVIEELKKKGLYKSYKCEKYIVEECGI